MSRKKGVLLSYILMILEVLSTLLLTPFIIRSLGGAEYGVYKLSASIVSYLMLLDLGVGNAVTRYVAKYRANNNEEDCRKFLGVTVIFYAAIALICVIIGLVLVAVFPATFAKGLTPDEISLGQTLLLVTVLNAALTLGTAQYQSIIIAYERFDVSRGSSIVQIIVRVALTILVLKLGMGSVGIVWITLFLTLVFRLYLVYFVNVKLKLKPVFRGINMSFIKEVTVYSSLILLQMIATQINACADSILLGIIVPSASVLIATYGIGQLIVQYYQSIGSAVNSVLMPGVVKMVETGASPDTLCNEMVRIGRWIFMLLGGIWCCFLVFGQQFIDLWAGKEYSQAYVVAIMLLTAHLFILTEAIGTQILWAKGEHKEQSVLKISIVVINIGLTILLINWQPLYGATLGTLISLLFGDVFVMNLVFKRKLKISLLSYYKGLFKGILPSMVIAAAAGFLFMLLGLNNWVGFFINVGVMVVIYLAMLFLFGLNPYEKGTLTGILKKVLRK